MTGRDDDKPNLQNIPIRTEEGTAVRRAFVDPQTWGALDIDFAEAERRVMDQHAPAATTTPGEDVHRAKAAELFGVPVEEVTPEMRRRAKEWTFAERFGGTPEKLRTILGIGGMK